ncbi:hypothetical protein HPB49_002758 [Dermacentor silvarum]|uniref:Uncharacterized protein n=1 Tax=Dermacentor silvarum TaxID=543639 RepID=A0ACB8DAG6_DERSI|nr:hypothetical protein HPB49_002758 [Dermacentor silvarum]
MNNVQNLCPVAMDGANCRPRKEQDEEKVKYSRAENVTLASMTHSVKNLPPYSSFFNPIEEMFSKFKWHVKAFLSERHQEVLTTPPGMTKKDHRRAMLNEAAVHSMQRVQSADCASYDQHTFSFWMPH